MFKDSLSGKLHKDGDSSNDNEVKNCQFVHLLAHTGLPTLWTERVRQRNKNTQLSERHINSQHSQMQIYK